MECRYTLSDELRILLKSEFLIHRYAVYENFQEKISYGMTERKDNYNAPGVCITEDFREVNYFKNETFSITIKTIRAIYSLMNN